MNKNTLQSGTPASGGLACALSFVIKDQEINITKKTTTDIESEKKKLFNAIANSKLDIQKIHAQALKKYGKDNAEIFEAHLLVLEDPEILGQTKDFIEQEKASAEFAFFTITQNYIQLFKNMKNDYMKERATDIEDVSSRVLGYLLGEPKKDLSQFNQKVILVANDITPSEMATLDIENVCGFITTLGGKTSHAAIMARTLEIPAITGVAQAVKEIPDHTQIFINGDTAQININPSSAEIQEFEKQFEIQKKQKQELLKIKDLPCLTKDGKTIRLASNIGTPDNIAALKDNGVHEVGLFRTEFIFMNRKTLPTEEEQTNAYKKVLSSFAPESVIIRTLDIGGDKELPYLKLPKEMNPFLGVRAIRLCFSEKQIFHTQLRALLKASEFGNLKIMFPMISSHEEIIEAKKILKDVHTELQNENPQAQYKYETGIMIEIPSAALISDQLAEEVDFFSIGTNDLIQYTCAVDRMNEKIHHLYNPYHPAVLKLITMTIENAHKNGKWVGMCGEMAGQLEFIPYLIGLGLDELSVSLGSYLKAKKVVLNLDTSECKKLSVIVNSLKQSSEIELTLKNFLERNR